MPNSTEKNKATPTFSMALKSGKTTVGSPKMRGLRPHASQLTMSVVLIDNKKGGIL